MDVRPYRVEEDGEATYRLRRLAFGGPRTPDPEWLRANDSWIGLVAGERGSHAGFLRIWRYGQFYGGRSVPMGGIASVAVDPSMRGRGVAGALLVACLERMRAEGLVLSALYPAAVPLYRRYGWEQAGVFQSVDLATTTLPRHRGGTIRAGVKEDAGAILAAYTRVASQVDGALDRGSPAFDPAAVLDEDIVTVVPGADGVTGYLVAQRAAERLVVEDLVADDVPSAMALLDAVASWAGQLDSVRLRVLDPVVHATLLALPYHLHVSTQPWMVRVVDLVPAVAARGWPAAAALRPLAVDVEVTDEHAPWQQGRYRIVCEDGQVRAEPGGSGAVRLTVRGLSAWYAGAATAATLRRAGLLDGDLGDAAALDALTGAPRLSIMADAF
ncbi:putative acetyltransferase [Labedaea rhizosphaerae]|uniref:Putative acetyltransferase n=2 Tax=Labedaea rhizosphaerae TaxID=598644 RepID=A0A4R6SKH6_LABRH|nr:putative acetyltransferase [Labedaea rhizosphaerae]